MYDGGETIERVESLALESFSLARLARFVALAADPAVQAVPTNIRLARRAAASAFVDCVELGRRDEALVILRVTFSDQAEEN